MRSLQIVLELPKNIHFLPNTTGRKLVLYISTMADKEATVYIVDVGKSMGRCRHGREISDLEWAMRYVWDKVTTTVRGESSILTFLFLKLMLLFR